MKLFGKVAAPVLSAIIGLIALRHWNLFAHFTFVEPDKAYDIGIAVYFAVADVVIEAIKTFICETWNKTRVSVDVMISGNNVEGDLNVNPKICFNSNDQAEACVTCKISGKGSYLNNSFVKITAPSFATIQVDNKRPEIFVDEKGTYVINLGALFSDGNIVSDITYQYRILFVKEYCDGEMAAKIVPVYCDNGGFFKKLHVNYRNNFLKLYARR